jgi:hypothetical protein
MMPSSAPVLRADCEVGAEKHITTGNPYMQFNCIYDDHATGSARQPAAVAETLTGGLIIELPMNDSRTSRWRPRK